jgi:hypothetical protein
LIPNFSSFESSLPSTDTFPKATIFQSTSFSLEQATFSHKHLLPKQLPLDFNIFTMSESTNNDVTVAEVSQSLTTLNINAIPEVVLPYGSLFSRLPNELLFMIMKWYMLIGPLYIPGRVVLRGWYNMINGFDCLKRIRTLNKSFHDLVMQCFYEFGLFSFKVEVGVKSYPCTFTPPTFFRHHLRRIQLQLFLDVNNDMTTVKELMAGSSAARLLHDFNSDTVGFTNLVDLVLDLHMDSETASDGDEPVMAVIKKAGFSVRAREVKVIAHRVNYRLRDYDPFPELAALVAVEE